MNKIVNEKKNHYLTIVFKDPSHELVQEVIGDETCVFMSWNHVPNERDRLAEELKEYK